MTAPTSDPPDTPIATHAPVPSAPEQAIGPVQRLGAVVIPTIEAELDDLIATFERWDSEEFRARAVLEDRPTIDLIVLYNRHIPSPIVDRITTELDARPWARGAFRHVFVDSANLLEAEDTYSGEYISQRRDELRYGDAGYKAGPNSQFFYMAERCRDYPVVLQVEVDCFAVRPDWLTRAEATVAQFPHDFWLMGSVYRGKSQMEDLWRHHINGNAFYATGNREFQQFLRQEFRPYCEQYIAEIDPRMAYDTMFEVFLRREENWPRVQQIRHRFTYSPFVMNYGGDPTHTGGDQDSVAHLLERNPYCYMIHGKYLEH